MFGRLNGGVSKFILTFFFYRATEQHNKDKAGYSIGDRDEYGSTVWLIALDLTSKEHRVAMRPLDSCPFSSLNLYLWNCFRHLKGLSRWHYNIWMELRVFRRHSVLFSPPGHSLDILDASDVLYAAEISLWAREVFWSPFIYPTWCGDFCEVLHRSFQATTAKAWARPVVFSGQVKSQCPFLYWQSGKLYHSANNRSIGLDRHPWWWCGLRGRGDTTFRQACS